MNNSDGFKLFIKELENDEKVNTCDIKRNCCFSKKKISYSNRVIQNIRSSICGLYCLGFLCCSSFF